MFTEYLDTLGFEEKQQQVILALVDLGKLNASALSRQSNIPRATLYAVLEKLIEQGVVAKETIKRTTVYFLTHPDSFIRIIDQQREQLELRETAARNLARSLTPVIQGLSYNVPKLQIFEGKQSIENMLYEYLPHWRESLAKVGDMTLWGYQDPSFVESYFQWHNHMWEARSSNEYIRLFSNKADVEQELQYKTPRREIRALPEGTKFSSSIWIYGDFIVMGMTKQRPHYVIQIQDSIFAANLRVIFALLWNAKL